jgi:hypothetical protein
VIGQHFDNTTGETFIGHERVGAMIGLKPRAAWSAIKNAEKRGWLEVIERGNGRGKANRYRIGFRQSSQLSATFSSPKTSQYGAKNLPKNCQPTLSDPSDQNSPEQPNPLGAFGERLERKVGSAVFRSWFSKLKIEGVTDQRATISTETAFIRSRLMRDYHGILLRCWQHDQPEVQELVIIVRPRQTNFP